MKKRENIDEWLDFVTEWRRNQNKPDIERHSEKITNYKKPNSHHILEHKPLSEEDIILHKKEEIQKQEKIEKKDVPLHVWEKRLDKLMEEHM